MAREKIKNIYLPPPEQYEFVSTGCTTLDCVLGGGWCLGRVVNLLGDKSTAKTGLATEAVINFLKQYPNGSAYYRETEAAFLIDYAQNMGMPIDRVDFGEEPLTTVEDFDRDLTAIIDHHVAAKTPAIYILDSLDALSDEGEMERDIAEGTYGTTKAKTLSITLRKNARKLERTRILLLIVSQLRENIDRFAFGEKYKRSGGKALDYYFSQVVWLTKCDEFKRTVKGVQRIYGIEITAKAKKNKVGVPFRSCDFPFIFYYGIDDLASCVNWLKEVNRLKDAGIEDAKKYFENTPKMNKEEYRAEQARLAGVVKTVWAEIDKSFMPKFSKYG